MIKFKLKKFCDNFIRCFIFGFLSITIILFSFIPCFATEATSIDLTTLTPFPNSDVINFTKTSAYHPVDGKSIHFTRFQSPNGGLGLAYYCKLSQFFTVSHSYYVDYVLWGSSTGMSIYMGFSSDLSSLENMLDNGVCIAQYSSSQFPHSQAVKLHSSFTISESLSSGPIYFVCWVGAPNAQTTCDISDLHFSDQDDFSGDWGKDDLTLDDVDTSGLMEQFVDNEETLTGWLTDFSSNSFVVLSIHGVGSLLTSFFADFSSNLTPIYLALLFAGVTSIVIVLLRHVGSFRE